MENISPRCSENASRIHILFGEDLAPPPSADGVFPLPNIYLRGQLSQGYRITSVGQFFLSRRQNLPGLDVRDHRGRFLVNFFFFGGVVV